MGANDKINVKPVQDALAEAVTKLNEVTDAEFKARRLQGLRPLTLAANAIELAQKHLASAEKRTSPKEDAPAGGGETAAPATGTGTAKARAGK